MSILPEKTKENCIIWTFVTNPQPGVIELKFASTDHAKTFRAFFHENKTEFIGVSGRYEFAKNKLTVFTYFINFHVVLNRFVKCTTTNNYLELHTLVLVIEKESLIYQTSDIPTGFFKYYNIEFVLAADDQDWGDVLYVPKESLATVWTTIREHWRFWNKNKELEKESRKLEKLAERHYRSISSLFEREIKRLRHNMEKSP